MESKLVAGVVAAAVLAFGATATFGAADSSPRVDHTLAWDLDQAGLPMGHLQEPATGTPGGIAPATPCDGLSGDARLRCTLASARSAAGSPASVGASGPASQDSRTDAPGTSSGEQLPY